MMSLLRPRSRDFFYVFRSFLERNTRCCLLTKSFDICTFAFFFMARILSIDFGAKRSGIAVTDPLQIIVSALETVETNTLLSFLDAYLQQESVEKIVIGMPVHKDGSETYLKKDINAFANAFKRQFPAIMVDFADERFSSVHAKQIILDSGIKKKKRQDKALIDKISAVVILQRYLNHI